MKNYHCKSYFCYQETQVNNSYSKTGMLKLKLTPSVAFTTMFGPI